MTLWIQLTLAGIASGSVYALAGMGLVLTYKATGVFNFAYGAVGMFVAYILWQMNDPWGIPLLISAPIAIFLVGPAIGLALERVVFRPLERKGATTSEKLVATLGIFLVFVGAAYAIWTGTVRHGPRLVTSKSVHLFGSGRHQVSMGTDQLAFVAFVVVASVVLWALFRYTHFGTEMRAVVDRRELSELAGINANRVSGVAWAMGCGLAGLTGILLAPGQLDPIHLTLFVVESFAVAVVARLVSLPFAVAGGVLLLGVGQTLLTKFNPHYLGIVNWKLPSWLSRGIVELKPNLPVIVLFVALVLYRRLDEAGEGAGEQRRGLIAASLGQRRRRGGVPAWLVAAIVGAVGIVIPFVLSHINLAYAQIMLPLIVIFVSIVCVTGFSGHVTLGQAAFAGMGGFVSTRVANEFGIPVILAMVLGALAATLVGVVAGFPALKRRGLYLGLTTFTIGVLAFDYVFVSNLFAGGPGGLTVHRPQAFDGVKAFYWFELAWVGLMILLAHNLRSGRLGRILAAMRDSEVAARSVGINLRTYKLFIFAASAFIAGIGGALLTQQARAFQGLDFHPINTSLLWFMVVIACGVDSIGGAVLGGVLLEILDIWSHTPGFSQLVIAIAALSLGWLPGGSLMGLLKRAGEWAQAPRGLMQTFARAQREQVALAGVNGNGKLPPAAQPDDFEPSDFATRVLEEAADR